MGYKTCPSWVRLTEKFVVFFCCLTWNKDGLVFFCSNICILLNFLFYINLACICSHSY